MAATPSPRRARQHAAPSRHLGALHARHRGRARLVYPVAIWGIGTLLFHHQASGSLIVDDRTGTVIGSELVGQSWTKPQYFWGRPSAAGKGYDPTQTGGTNFGPTSKKLIDATKSAIAALEKANPDATGPIPMDLVTSSASGIDPGHLARGRVLSGAAGRQGARDSARRRARRDRRARHSRVSSACSASRA